MSSFVFFLSFVFHSFGTFIFFSSYDCLLAQLHLLFLCVEFVCFTYMLLEEVEIVLMLAISVMLSEQHAGSRKCEEIATSLVVCRFLILYSTYIILVPSKCICELCICPSFLLIIRLRLNRFWLFIEINLIEWLILAGTSSPKHSNKVFELISKCCYSNLMRSKFVWTCIFCSQFLQFSKIAHLQFPTFLCVQLAEIVHIGAYDDPTSKHTCPKY